MPPLFRQNPLLLPFTRTSIDNIKLLLKHGKISPSVSWHPAPDVHIPAITPGDISDIGARNVAVSSGPFDQSQQPKKTRRQPYQYDLHRPKHAAVLVALANIAVPPQFFRKEPEAAEIMPSMMLEVRSSKMRAHAGEVR